MLISQNNYFETVLHNSLLQLLLKNCNLLNTDISQGSAATLLGCGGVFKYDFVTNFLLSLTVKNFENLLIFGEDMGKSLVSCFFDSQCYYIIIIVISQRW